MEPISSHTLNRSTLFSKHTEGNKLPDALIIGAVAEDLTCCISDGAKDDSFLYTSHPGTIKSSIGGVAYNIARTASYINSNVQLVSEVDSETILTQLANEGLDTSGIKKSNMPTSRFVAIHNGSGELLTAVADMDTIAHMSTDHIKSIIENCKPKIVFFDGNLGPAQKTQIIKSAKSVGSLIGFEPTSVSKASKIAQISLDVFPNNKIDIATPNKLELEAMFSAFSSNGMFDVENWFPVIDVLNINQEFRMAMESLSKSSPDLQQLVSSGMSQQAFHLLPYIPTLLVKDGSNGVTLFQLLTEISAIKRSVCSSSSSRICVGQNDLGIVVQHFPAYPTSNDKIINVNGAGDTLLGVILSELAIDTSWIYTIGDEKNLIMDKAQFAASLTLQSDKSVSPALGSLKEYI